MVVTYKYTSDSALPTYKGFKKEQGVDFDEIFSPVVKMSILRKILASITKKNLDLFQMDVKTAFRHGDLDEEIYMEQLKGYEVLKPSSQKLCKKFNAFNMMYQSYYRTK